MIRTRRTQQIKFISGINITPFTDVVLVLLIIFMLTASNMNKPTGIPINLPKSSNQIVTPPSRMMVEIPRDQRVLLNGKQVAMGELGKQISDIDKGTGQTVLIIKADEMVPYGTVIHVMDIASKAGISRFSQATAPEQNAR